METLEICDTWDLVSLPKGRNPIRCKWVFKKKFGVDGQLERYKAKIVAKGYFEREGVDFGEILSPIAKITYIRFLLSIVIFYDFEIDQIDVKTNFLHGDLEEDIYMRQPNGFVEKGK